MNTIARLPLMIVSLVLSMLLWVYVQVQENPPKTPPPFYVLDIQLRHLPTDLQVVSPPEQIKVFPQGADDERARIDEKDLTAFIDLSNARVPAAVVSSAQYYPVHLVVRGDYAVTWQPRSPVARVVIQRKKTKQVPVKVQPYGALPIPDALYLPESTFTEPATVNVTGPESDVEGVISARATLDLARTESGKGYWSDIELLQTGDRPAPSTVAVEPRRVLVHPAIAIGLQNRTAHVQPTFVNQPAVGYGLSKVEVNPPDVLLRGRAETLGTLSFVRGQPIDLTGLKSTTNFVLVPDLPQDVTVVSQTPINVRVTISPTGPPVTTPPVVPGAKTGKRRAGG